MKLRNKKGEAFIFATWFACLMIGSWASYGAYKQDRGEWGKNGSDNLQARQAKIVASGGHINQAPGGERRTFDY